MDEMSETLKTLKPTLAVRGVACLMCHADIRSNLVTDFGYGNSFYLGGTKSFEGAQWYNNYVDSWMTSQQIAGTVFVPDVLVTQKAMDVLSSPTAPLMKLKDFMLTPYLMKSNWNKDYTTKEMAFKITPPFGDRVISKTRLIIRAPEISEIQALAPQIFSNGTTAAFVRVNKGNTANPNAPSLKVIDNGQGPFTMNDETQMLECQDSDVVVNGTLYLRNLKLNSAGGCRIYVTGSVFIEGPITYSASGVNPNLQITSAAGILMGINQKKLVNRLLTDNRGAEIEGPVDYSTLANQIVAEGVKVGSRQDAQDITPRISIDYNGLLLNAKLVQSRYLGNVKGTVIAQLALFALGQFHFEFDPVFTKVNVLPQLAKPVLVVH